MSWLPPRGPETLKAIACNRGLWEDLGNGYVTKRPKKKKTSAQVTVESGPDDDGQVRLCVEAQHAGPAPRIHYAEDSEATDLSSQLRDRTLSANALRVTFRVADPSGQYQVGDPVVWTNKLVLRNRLAESDGMRTVALYVAPRGTIRYTLDGREPRDGTEYRAPIPIGAGEVLVRAFAEAEGLETKAELRFPAAGEKDVPIDSLKPGRIVSRTGRKLDSRAKTFEGLKQAAERSVTFEGIGLTVGQGSRMIALSVGEIPVEGPFIEAILNKVLEKFPPDTPVTMTFRKAHFMSRHDLKGFAGKLGIEPKTGDVEQ